MFEMLTRNEEDALNILKHDHHKVKILFEQFEASDSPSEKKKIAMEVIRELKIHATLEEEIFYPAVRNVVRDEIMNEANEEHHVAKVLIAELEKMAIPEDQFDAKFCVLAESVRHHIKEEEGEMFPEAKGAGIDFEAVGRAMLARKRDLLERGVPHSPEEKMVAASLREPAKAPKVAKTRKSKPIRKKLAAKRSDRSRNGSSRGHEKRV